MPNDPIFRDGVFKDLDWHRPEGGILRDGVFRGGVFDESSGVTPIDFQLRFSVKPGAGLTFDFPFFPASIVNFAYYTSEDPTVKTVTTWNDADAQVSFLTDVEHTIFCDGVINGFSFEGSLGKINNNNDKMRDMKNCGSLEVQTENYSFFDCPELTWSATDPINKASGLPANVESMWESCPKMTVCVSAAVSDWTNVTNAQGCFDSCILLNQALNLFTPFCTNFKWFMFGCSAQAKAVTVRYTVATTVEGMFESCILFNHPIVFSTGADVVITNANDFLYNASAHNSAVTGFANFKNLTTAEGFYEKSGFDRDETVNLGNVPVGLNVKRFWNDTPLGDRTITMNMRRVDEADNMFTNCFSQSAASWSDFMSAVNIQVTELQTGVKIDAEAQHTVAGGNAISNIAALKTWAITDRGPIPP